MAVVPSSTPKLKQWMVQQVDSEKYPGLVWENRKLGMFRIPWKHASHQDYRHDKDAAIFEAWARYKGSHKDRQRLNPRTWKSRLRCALHKSSDFQEVPQLSQLNSFEPYKVYKILGGTAERQNPPSRVHLISVRVEGCEGFGKESAQHNSRLPVLDRQVKTEPVSAERHWAQGDSSSDLGSAPEEGSGKHPSPCCTRTDCTEGRGEGKPPWATPLSCVKLEEIESGGTQDTLPSNSAGSPGVTDQVQSEAPSLDPQPMENDSHRQPSSVCRLSPPALVPLAEPTQTPGTQERFPLAVPLSSVKMEGSGNVAMETSRSSSPLCNPVGAMEEIRSDGAAPGSQPVESVCSCDPSSGSEGSAHEEIPGESTSLEWGRDRSPEVVNNYTFNINEAVNLAETVSNVYTININDSASLNVPGTVVNHYTINIGSPSPPSNLARRAVPNNYTININNITSPRLTERVMNNYSLNINRPTVPTLTEKGVNNYTVNINRTAQEHDSHSSR